MALLDAQTLATALNRRDLSDEQCYNPQYIAMVIADATASLVKFLGYDPVLQVVTDEEGYVEYDSSGEYRGLYRLILAHAPLIPGTAATVFSSLVLTLGRAASASLPVTLPYVSMRHKSGRVFIGPGGMSYPDLNLPLGESQAGGYVASYVAGYATGIADPTLPGNVSYGALPMPADITQAAVLLCRERLAMDDAQNMDNANAAAGSISSLRTADQQITYGGMVGGSYGLGYGSPLAQAAAAKLRPWQRTVIA